MRHEGDRYVVTNWHVVTAKDAATGAQTGETPTELMVRGFRADKTRVEFRVPLMDPVAGTKHYLEHPWARQIDVVALKVEPPADMLCFDIELTLAETDLAVPPGSVVHVIGFPLGVGANVLPIWKTGHLAADEVADENKLFIDARTQKGMSGSPVLAIARQIGRQKSTGDLGILRSPAVRFLGVYSGRQTVGGEVSDIGWVWKPVCVVEVLWGDLNPGRNCRETAGAARGEIARIQLMASACNSSGAHLVR
jgi:hypothetical protein